MFTSQSDRPLKKIHLIYMYAGLLLLTFYAIYHLNWGIFGVGLVCAIDALLLGLVSVQNLRLNRNTWPQNVFAVIMSLTIVYITYMLGFRGLVYIFPYTVALFFHLPHKKALFTSVLLAVATLLATLNLFEWYITAFASIPIILTITLSFMYAIKVKQHEEALQQEADQDYLTEIFNRRSFMRWLQRSITSLKPKSILALYYVDIDDFKRINDTYGHGVGDALLREISRRILLVCRATDTVCIQPKNEAARIAGDEFVVAVSDLGNVANINTIAERLLKSINQPTMIKGINISAHASIGVASTGFNAMDPEQLISDADRAMYKAKKLGKNQITFFDQTLADEISENNNIIIALKNALEKKLFHLNFMPIYCTNAKSICGAEALIRTSCKKLSENGPDLYIPIAEEMGLIQEIDLFVIEESFKCLQEIAPELRDENFVLAVNISALELKNSDFPVAVAALVEKYSIQPGFIEFEITETSLINHDESSIGILEQLKKQGFKLSLDDFGTGYTAFNQLQKYPVDTLKIDRSFVKVISPENQKTGSMVDVILSLAKLYKLNVIAEGVEQQFQLDYLQAQGCSQYQGYLLSRPISWSDLKSKLAIHH